LDFYLSPLTSINLKLIKDLNVRPEAIKLLGAGGKNNIREKPLDVDLGSNFSDMTTKAHTPKAKMKWGYIK